MYLLYYFIAGLHPVFTFGGFKVNSSHTWTLESECREGHPAQIRLQISEMFENAPAQLFVALPLSYRQLIGENGRKTLTHVYSGHYIKGNETLIK